MLIYLLVAAVVGFWFYDGVNISDESTLKWTLIGLFSFLIPSLIAGYLIAFLIGPSLVATIVGLGVGVAVAAFVRRTYLPDAI